MRTSLKHLSQLVQNNKIVICEANKDGKIIIVDYCRIPKTYGSRTRIISNSK